jgi:chemotaxis protein methyltransferase CheR
MILHVTELEFKLLRDLIYEHSGIFLPDNKAYLIETRLAGLVKEFRCASFGEFYVKAKSSPEAGQLCGLMVDAITTNETSWFRDRYPYQILRAHILPEFDKEMAAGRRKRINIWSAACSTGQEPYSLAITVLDFYNDSNRDSTCHNWVNIHATDISSTSLAQAVEGRYDNISINRGLEQKHLDRYFKKDSNSGWLLDDKVKKMVSFKPCNLKAHMMKGECFDVVFLRNVMIYFSDSLKRELFDRMADTLVPPGYLFLGTGETVNGYTTKFEMIEHQRAFYYRLKATDKTAIRGNYLK